MRVAVALGSGGARGYAHIGVLQALHARGHEVTAIAGTSAGALIGGLHAGGKLDEFVAWTDGLTQRELLALLDPGLGQPGMVRGQRVVDLIAGLLGDARIEKLPIPYVAVATDVVARREVWFEHGPLVAAIRASIAIPSALAPVMLRGRLLVDGGVMNPVPMDALSAWDADFTLAVDLNAPSGRSGGQPVAESADETPPPAWLRSLRRTAAQLSAPLTQLGRREDPEPEPDLGFEPVPRDLRTADVFTLSLNASQALVTRFRTAANPPDVWVRVPADARGTLDFLRGAQTIELGRALADEALDRAGF